jgi:cell wall assembly regulator SMI1
VFVLARVGLDPASLAGLEDKLGSALPGPARALYQWRDGFDPRGEHGWFGWHWLSLEAACAERAAMLENAKRWEAEGLPSEWATSWLPFATDHAGCFLCLDMADEAAPLVRWNDGDAPQKLAPSLADFVELVVEGLESSADLDEDTRHERFWTRVAQRFEDYRLPEDPIKRLQVLLDRPGLEADQRLALARKGIALGGRHEGFYIHAYNALLELERPEEMLELIEGWRALFPGYARPPKQAEFRGKRLRWLRALERNDEYLSEARELLDSFARQAFDDASVRAKVWGEIAEIELARENADRALEALRSAARQLDPSRERTADQAGHAWRVLALHSTDEAERKEAIGKAAAALDLWLEHNPDDGDARAARAALEG